MEEEEYIVLVPSIFYEDVKVKTRLLLKGMDVEETIRSMQKRIDELEKLVMAQYYPFRPDKYDELSKKEYFELLCDSIK